MGDGLAVSPESCRGSGTVQFGYASSAQTPGIPRGLWIGANIACYGTSRLSHDQAR